MCISTQKAYIVSGKYHDRIRVLLANLKLFVSQKREYIIGRLYIKETNRWLKRKVTTTL